MREVLSINNATVISRLATTVFLLLPLSNGLIFADSQFNEKAIAVIQSCDNSVVNGFATLKERASPEGVKQVDVYMQINGLTSGKHAVHIHETATCLPCGSAGGHFDPGNFGMTNPDANHPYHSGDLINIDSQNGNGLMTTHTSRVTLSSGPLSLFDADGSSFIVHTNEDSYCPGGEAAGCAGGSRSACGIISKVNLADNFELMVSRSSSRRNPIELSNAGLNDNVYIFISPLNPSLSIQEVTFYLDGNEFNTEDDAPFDFAGTFNDISSNAFDSNDLSDGAHTVSAKIKLSTNTTTYVSSAFMVENIFNSSDVIKVDFSSNGDNDGGNLSDWNQINSASGIPAGSVKRHGDGAIIPGVNIALSNFSGSNFTNNPFTANWPSTDPYYLPAADDIYYHNGSTVPGTISFNGLDPSLLYNIRIYSLIGDNPNTPDSWQVTSAGGTQVVTNTRGERWQAPNLEAAGMVFTDLSANGSNQIIVTTPLHYFPLNTIILETVIP